MPIPAVTTAHMIEVDWLMTEVYGISLVQMMENAGRSLAELAVRWLNESPVGKQVVVACGAGNNGGGGMVAARHLHNRGARVAVALAGEMTQLKEVPAHQWRILQTIGLPAAQKGDLASADLILDALIGYGLKSPAGSRRSTARAGRFWRWTSPPDWTARAASPENRASVRPPP